MMVAMASFSQVRGKKLHHFTGSFKKFLAQRKERDAQLTATAEAQADEIARLQVFVDRFGAKVRSVARCTAVSLNLNIV